MTDMVERVGRALDDAWNSEGKDLPPIELSQDERNYLARAVIEAMREPTDAIERAIAGSRAKDDEGIFERLADQLDYSGENKMWTVVRQAWRDGIDAALSQEEAVRAEERERCARVAENAIAPTLGGAAVRNCIASAIRSSPSGEDK